MIGGEGAASASWMTRGSWIDYAERFGALLFQVEHRYYGESHPTEDISTENLKYLTSQQALADLATFIVAMNEKYNFPSDKKWIAFGGSYSGSLAAWLRFKYPHLVHGAMSASGPLLAQLNFKDYFRVVSESLATHSDECVAAIKSGVEQIDIRIQEESGQEVVNKIFNLCDPLQETIENPDDITTFYETIADNFAGIVQYNKIGYTEESITIDVLCDIMVNETIGNYDIDRLGAINDLLLSSYQETCLDYKYDNMINYLKDTSWNSSAAEGSRQWTYQTCTEFGFYQTSDYEPHIFGNQFPVSFFIDQCSDIFGPLYVENFLDAAIERSNTLYGGLDIEVSNVVFVHGSIDPWHALGITKTVDEAAPAIYIEGAAHCANMYPASEADVPELDGARDQVGELIGSWLN